VLPGKDLLVSFRREANFPTQMLKKKLRKKYILVYKFQQPTTTPPTAHSNRFQLFHDSSRQQ
jgi:hypothetical protein